MQTRLFTLSLVLCSLYCAQSMADGAAEQKVAEQIVAAAIERTAHQVNYDGAYVVLDYPNGDVPATQGLSCV